jgi:hypothetical protein
VIAVGDEVPSTSSDVPVRLAAFGSWAAVSGAIQLGVAVHNRRTEGVSFR